MTDLAPKLKELGGDIHGPLEEVSVPMYVLDREGTIVWLNDATRDLLPGATGKRFTEVLTPELVHPSRRHYTLRMLGQEPFLDHQIAIRTPSHVRMVLAQLGAGSRLEAVLLAHRTGLLERPSPSSDLTQ